MSAEIINLRAARRLRRECKLVARAVKSSTTWFPSSGSYVGGEKWLTSQPPETELAILYAIRGVFRDGDRKRDARIDELYSAINPTIKEHAAILDHSLKISARMREELGG
jgi:hypothetical protein